MHRAAGVDLISFSGILYSIYPPLFLALLVYSIGGTGTSLFLGRKLVGLNFQQEAQEANFRCSFHMLLQLLAQRAGNDGLRQPRPAGEGQVGAF